MYKLEKIFQEITGEDNEIRNKQQLEELIESKKSTRLTLLVNLESQLQSSGKLTDELTERFEKLFEELSNVGNNRGLALFDEQIKQLKDDIKTIGDSFENVWNKRLNEINKVQKKELDSQFEDNVKDILNRGKTTKGAFEGSYDNKGNWIGSLAQETEVNSIPMTRYEAIIQLQKDMISTQKELNNVLDASFKSDNPEAYKEAKEIF